MGIRFACHVCNKQLNIKRDLAGRRGVCPQCQSRFRIPTDDTEQSTPVDAVRIVQPNSSKSAGHPNSPQHAAQLVAAVPHAGGAAVLAENEVVSDAAVSVPAVPNLAQSITQSKSVQDPVSQDLGVGSILDEEPNATWYVRPPNGGQYGPASTEELQDWIKQGRVAATALLWRDGWPQWRDAREALPEMSASLPGVTDGGGNPSSVFAATDVQLDAVGHDTVGHDAEAARASVSLSGETGIGAERRSRTMRRISMISILVAISATLIGVLFYVINR